MKIHCLQHTANHGHTYLPEWAASHGHQWVSSIVPETGLPDPAQVDCLVVLGGPMSAWDEATHPWLRREKRFLQDFVAGGKPLLGVCLGAQLLAEVLGARTFPGRHKEIGWFRAEAPPESRRTWLGAVLPERFETFFWHGDSFEIPPGAVRIASSQAFPNQGFVYRQVLALQFHLEVKPEWVRFLARRDAHELIGQGFVQDAETVLGKPEALYRENNRLLDRLLQRWLAEPVGSGA
jgi:GMP synthase-like glutamine amidotransferase